MQVELDMFSGRPNPQWNLTREKMIELKRMMQSLPKDKTTKPLIPALGYRGFIVTAIEDKIEGYSEIFVFKEYVSAKYNNEFLQFTDEDRTLERWLLQTGREYMKDNIYRHIGNELRINTINQY